VNPAVDGASISDANKGQTLTTTDTNAASSRLRLVTVAISPTLGNQPHHPKLKTTLTITK